MSCKKCRHWFVNPNIVIPVEPTEGKCLVSEIKTQSNQVCNAWERSEVDRENGPTECIDKLIEAGNLMKSQINAVYHFQPAAVDNWDAALGRWNNRQQEVTE